MPKQPRPRPASAAGAEARRSASIFAALGDQTRLRMVVRLSGGGPLSITSLAAGSRITRQAITKHLRVMEGVGLVRSTRQGRETVWQLQERGLKAAHQYLDLISKQWDGALGRLRQFVKD